MNRRGLTLLEVVIASIIFTALAFAIYTVLFASQTMHQREIDLRDSQYSEQAALDQISRELLETNPALIRVVEFQEGPTVPFSATPASPTQAVLAFPSAMGPKDPTKPQLGEERKINPLTRLPAWQKLVVYAPLFNPSTQRGALYRYELNPIPSGFDSETAFPAITVSADSIRFGPTAADLLPRDPTGVTGSKRGRPMVERLTLFRILDDRRQDTSDSGLASPYFQITDPSAPHGTYLPVIRSEFSMMGTMVRGAAPVFAPPPPPPPPPPPAAPSSAAAPAPSASPSAAASRNSSDDDSWSGARAGSRSGASAAPASSSAAASAAPSSSPAASAPSSEDPVT